MGFYVNKAEEFESVIEDNIREGRTRIENDKCKEYLSTLSTLTDENKERKLLPFYVKLPTKDKVLLKNMVRIRILDRNKCKVFCLISFFL